MELTNIEQNILIGSILGDGSLALYGRSKNAYYREHGCEKQNPYRQWKYQNLKRLGLKFSLKGKYGVLRSPSNKIFTDFYNLFYRNRIKVITNENIKLLNHPIGLTCLYLDDGTLVIDSSNKNNGKHLFPRIAIYTQCFTKEENIILINHIKHVFNIEFKLKKRPDGNNYILELNKINEITKFIDIISPYVNQIPEMNYIIDYINRMDIKRKQLQNSNIPNVSTIDLYYVDKRYTVDEENFIIESKKANMRDKDIALQLNRSYYGIVDKIRRLKIDGKL